MSRLWKKRGQNTEPMAIRCTNHPFLASLSVVSLSTDGEKAMREVELEIENLHYYLSVNTDNQCRNKSR